MSAGIDVFIQTTTVDGQIVTDQVTQTIIGVPGPQGAAGNAGPCRSCGTELLAAVLA